MRNFTAARTVFGRHQLNSLGKGGEVGISLARFSETPVVERLKLLESNRYPLPARTANHYDGEREYRLVCLNTRHVDSSALPSQGLLLRLFEPQRLIERVRVSPFAPPIVHETVSLLVERLALGIPVERSSIEINTYALI